MKTLKIVAIVMTYNEEEHIARCIESLRPAVDSIVVVDSDSTDATVSIAKSMGAIVLTHPWINHGVQFNWALEHLPPDTDWVFRVDADEVVSANLAQSIREDLPDLESSICGVTVRRRILYQGKKIRFGGWGGVKVLRLFRYGHGQSETRWMDEHIRVEGRIVDFNNELVDHNLKSLSWWIDKHNQYASKEAIELLKLKYQFAVNEKKFGSLIFGSAGRKRWIKNNIYAHIPLSFRAFLYFIYRYVFCLGFLDGSVGYQFHFFQGFWYRYLVDMKVAEVERLAIEQNRPIPDLIRDLFQVDVNSA